MTDNLQPRRVAFSHLEFLASAAGLLSEIQLLSVQISAQIDYMRSLAQVVKFSSPYSDCPHYSEVLTCQSRLVSLTSRRFFLYKRLAEVHSQLNGANGEFTGLDDIAPFYQELVDDSSPVIPPYWDLFSRVQLLAYDDHVIEAARQRWLHCVRAREQANHNLEQLLSDSVQNELCIDQERIALGDAGVAMLHSRAHYLLCVQEATDNCYDDLVARNRRYPWYYPLYYRARNLVSMVMLEFFHPGANLPQSSDGKKKRGGASAVISTFGSHDFVVDNSVSHGRREERVHAPQVAVAQAIKRHPKIASDSKKVRRAAERAHQKQQKLDRDLDRCRESLESLLSVIEPGNRPQFGFNLSWFRALGDKASAFSETCNSITDSVSKFTKSLSSLGDAVTAAMPYIGFTLKCLVAMLALGVAIYSVINGNYLQGCVAVILYYCLAFYAGWSSSDLIMRFLNGYEERFPDKKQGFTNASMADFARWNARKAKCAAEDVQPSPAPNEAQVGGALPAPDPSVLIPLDSSHITKLLVAVFSGGMLTFGQKKEGFAASLKDFVVSFPSVLKGVDGIVEFVSKILFDLLNKARSFYGFDKYDSLFASKDFFCGWALRAERYIDAMSSGEIKPSPSSLGILTRLIDEGRTHTQFLRGLTDEPGARARLSKLMTDLASKRDLCVSANPNIVSDRPEPVCIFLSGKPGRGKSTFAKMLAVELLLQVLPEVERETAMALLNAYLYHRTPETQYWDGYNRQLVTLVDDFLQKAEVAGGESVALDCIRIMNGCAALLHMADCDSKGRVYFASEFVIMTSNMAVPDTPAVTCIKAVQRRPDLCYAVDLWDEFLTPSDDVEGAVVDKARLAAVNALPSFEQRASVYKIGRYTIKGNGQPELKPGPVSPLQIVADIMDLRRRKAAVFNRVAPDPATLPPGFNAEAFAASLVAHQRGERLAPPNSAQCPQSFMMRYYDHPSGGLQKSKELRVFVTDWLLALQKYGPHSDETMAAYNALWPFITAIGCTWDDFIKDYEKPVKEAHRVWSKRQAEAEGSLFDELESGCFNYSEKGKEHEFSDNEILKKLDPDIRKDMADVDGKRGVSNKVYYGSLFTKLAIVFKEKAGSLFGFFIDYWKWILMVVGAIGLAFGAYKLVTSLTSLDNVPESFPVRHSSSAKKGQALAALRARREAAFRRLPNVSQGGSFAVVNGPNVAQGYDSLSGPMAKILAHTYHVFLSKESVDTIGHLSPIVDKVFVCNNHTVDVILAHAEASGIEEVWLRRYGHKGEAFNVKLSCFKAVHRDEHTKALDLVLVYCENSGVPHACDFIPHVATAGDIEKRDQLTILAPILGRMDAPFEYVVDHKAVVDASTGPYPNPVDRSDPYPNAVNISIHFKTIGGQCGLPYVTDCFGPRYYAAIHKCGNGTLAGASPLVREWLDEEMEWLHRRFPSLKLIRYMYARLPDPGPATNVSQCFPAVTFGAAKAPHASIKSKLRPLACAQDFDQKTAPAVLGITKVGGKWRSPYYLNRAKMPDFVPSFPPVKDLNLLVSKIINEGVRTEVSDLKRWRRDLTIEEAFKGIDGTVLRAIDLATSVGYHWVLTGKTTKSLLFSDPKLYAELMKDIDLKIKLLARGVRPLFLNMDVLKDERRTLEKVAQCSTRVVVVGPVELLILNRVYFGGFAAWTQENKIANGITVGMNPYGEEMNDLCQRLFKPGYKVFAGDKKKFDLSQHPVLLDAIFAGINDWYGPSPSNSIRSILSLEFVNAFHLTFTVRLTEQQRGDLRAELEGDLAAGNVGVWEVHPAVKLLNADENASWAWVYLACLGHPSGSFLTALINSWDSKLEPLVALQYLLEDWQSVLDIARSNRVYSATLGDDFITSVAPELQDRLNALTFARFSAMYGMEVTRENKEPIVEAWPNDDPVFLKRRLYYSGELGRYVGALDKDAIYDSISWTRTDNPKDTDLAETFKAACCEASLHGSEVYAEMAPKIEAAARKVLQSSWTALPWHAVQVATSALRDEYRP